RRPSCVPWRPVTPTFRHFRSLRTARKRSWPRSFVHCFSSRRNGQGLGIFTICGSFFADQRRSLIPARSKISLRRSAEQEELSLRSMLSFRKISEDGIGRRGNTC